PLYPHYSKATTGSSFREWNRVMNAGGMERLPGKLVESYFDHPLYIDALVQNIGRAIDRVPAEERSKIHLLFSAHGTPMKLVRDGDPYSHQIQRTVQLVVEKGRFGLPHHLCYQSKVGPQRWLEPKLTETIGSLGAEQVSHLIVVPIAFVTEHIETLSEINIEARELAMEAGIRYFDMMPALIDNEQFIACLADLAVQQLDERND
ncbi:MAG TPA: ferrochelatase, partial [Bacteroidota bacterium]|nr:ferrochelatase [Bacteroidota bacterium]